MVRRRVNRMTCAGDTIRSLVWGLTRVFRPSVVSQRRDVLLCCNDPLMADYLAPFAALFRNDPRIRFHAVFQCQGVPQDRVRHMKEQLPFPEARLPGSRSVAWDLLVCADHCLNTTCLRSPVVFLGHGLHGKRLPGAATEYAFGELARNPKGRIIYRRLFVAREADATAALAEDPTWKEVVAVVGDLQNDNLLAQTARREGFRKELGFGPRDTVVFFLSTWGPHCLLHQMGDELLRQARALQNEFRFMLSAHPHEYRPQPDGQRVWGEYLRSQRQYGFIVREPSEDWIPYLVASDIVVSDYTNLVQSAALLEKPIILTPVPDDVLCQGSTTWQLRQFAPVLNDARRLREYLVETREDYPRDKLRNLARTVHPHRGEAAERIRGEIYALLRLPPPGGSRRSRRRGTDGTDRELFPEQEAYPPLAYPTGPREMECLPRADRLRERQDRHRGRRPGTRQPDG
jgi:hypothetical protein